MITTTHAKTCQNCQITETTNPDAFSGAESNFVNEDGDASVLCLTCWDQQEGIVCSHCDRLAANYYTEEMIDANEWKEPWPSNYEAVCYDCAWDLLADKPRTNTAPRTITVTYQVVLEVLDEDASLNHAIDAVSLAVWHIGDDRDDFRTLTASMITAQENTQEDHDNRTCGCCN